MDCQQRYLFAQVKKKDLKQKMVFVGGARQVGKTTLAKHLLPSSQTGCLSWDIPDHREMFLKRELPDAPFWVFDEIHKYRDWRHYLKGIYDQYASTHQILVTGSA